MVAALAAAACSAQNMPRPATPADQPLAVEIHTDGAPHGDSAVLVNVQNRTAAPVTIHAIAVRTHSQSLNYGLLTAKTKFGKTIAPGATSSFLMMGGVISSGRPGPMPQYFTVEAAIDATVDGRFFHEVYRP